jgi:hypothetical protein
MQDIDFNLSQFGLFLQNDTIFITFHINDTVEKIGRKIIAGDVIELPHLKDQFALNDLNFALKRFFVIEEVSRAAEGFSVTWYPHLYRAKCKPLVDSQEFKDILNQLADTDGAIGDTNTTLRDIMSTYEKEMQITAGVLDQAEADAPKAGYDTTKYYHLQQGKDGKPELISADTTAIDAGEETFATDAEGNPLFDADGNHIYLNPTASATLQTVERGGYGSINGTSFDEYMADAIPANGAAFTAGISFPVGPLVGQFCLRTDYLPTRLFRYSGTRWIKVEDNVRMTMSNLGPSDVAPGQRFEGKDARVTQKTSFINNPTVTKINGHDVKEKQSLSKALRPQADE